MVNPQAEAFTRIQQAAAKMPNATYRELLATGLITKADIVRAYGVPIDWSK